MNGKMKEKIDAFLRSRNGQNNLTLHLTPIQYPYRTTTGNGLSLVLFIIFISDFLSNSIKRFKFADDSSVLPSGQTIAESYKDTCLHIGIWRRRWRMAANGSKTELSPLNNSHEDLSQCKRKGENCKISGTTKSLGLNIDSKINYKQHTEISVCQSFAKMAYPP